MPEWKMQEKFARRENAGKDLSNGERSANVKYGKNAVKLRSF